MKTDYQHLTSPAFWRPLGCELESIENQGGAEIVKVKDLLCEDSFVVILSTDTVDDVYEILKLRRKELTT